MPRRLSPASPLTQAVELFERFAPGSRKGCLPSRSCRELLRAGAGLSSAEADILYIKARHLGGRNEVRFEEFVFILIEAAKRMRIGASTSSGGIGSTSDGTADGSSGDSKREGNNDGNASGEADSDCKSALPQGALPGTLPLHEVVCILMQRCLRLEGASIDDSNGSRSFLLPIGAATVPPRSKRAAKALGAISSGFLPHESVDDRRRTTKDRLPSFGRRATLTPDPRCVPVARRRHLHDLYRYRSAHTT